MDKPTKNYVPLLASLFTASLVFWLLANYNDIYKHAVVGALFEIAWLPMVALFVLVPILSLVLWFRSKKRGYPAKRYLIFSIASGLIAALTLTA